MVEQPSIAGVQGDQNPNIVGGDGKPDGPAIKKLKSEDEAAFRDSPYFKIRSIVKELRPNFIEVLNTADFRSSKAAEDIRKQMKILSELTRQLKEAASTGKPLEHSSPGTVTKTEKPKKLQEEEVKKEPPSDPDNPGSKDLPKQLDEENQGTYMMGGSPIGWNFLVYPGTKAVYYGETKATFLSRQAKM